MRGRLTFRRTTVITAGLLAFLGGLGFARTRFQVSSTLFFVSFLLFLVTIKHLRLAALLSITLLGFVLGWSRGQVFMNQLSPLKQLSGQHVVATVQAASDGVYNDRSQLSFDADHLHVTDPVDEILPGKLSVAGFGESAVYKGDIIQFEAKLYASRGSHQLTASYAELKVLGRSGSPVDSLRRRYTAGMESSLPEPLASFGLGLLIGQRSTLPTTVVTMLSVVGLTHIIAVSGYNLTIIMRSVRRFLHKRSKYQITIFSLVLMILFLLTTGFSASIVRAAIVSTLSLLAWYYGRSFRPVLLLALAAVITAGWNPLYLWSDIGWYLSFLAFFGVIVVAPMITRRLYGEAEPKALTALIIESLCALAMTIPIILYIFHQVSVIALVANLLIVPLVPLAMFLSMLAGLAGMIVPVLSGLIALPARILLTYMLDLVQLLSKIPHALVERQLSLQAMIFIYICIISFALLLWRQSVKNAKITEKNLEQEHVWTQQMVNITPPQTADSAKPTAWFTSGTPNSRK